MSGKEGECDSVNSWLFQDCNDDHGVQKDVTNGHIDQSNNSFKMIPRPSATNPTTPNSYDISKDTFRKKPNCLVRAKDAFIYGLEKFFFNYGKFVARKPVAFIILSIVLTLACASGMVKFRKEETNNKLWIKHDSSSRLNSDWLWENYPPDFRYNSLLLEAEDENVLKPEYLRTMFQVYKGVNAIRTSYGDSWMDLCQPMPIVRPPDITDILGLDKKRRRKRQDDDTNYDDEFGFDSEFFGNEAQDFFDEGFEEEFDNTGNEDGNAPDDKLAFAEYFSANSYPDPYCEVVEGLELTCFETSILELWAEDGSFPDDAFESLTEQEILYKINNFNKSGIFLTEKNFTSYLSGIKYDESGNIVSAKATIMRWFGRMNGTAAKFNPAPDRAEPIDPKMLEFEGLFLDLLLNQTGYPIGLKSYPNAMRSFGDIAKVTILGDATKLGIGYTIVFIYVMIMLGKFNCVEQRAFLSMIGIFGVILGLLVSYGLCSLMGLFFGPMHNVLPFLLLGIGIDDMFVIVQCYDTLSEEDKKLKLPDRFGKTMQDAGVAITITSITDVIAFGIGGTTVLPALQSFCLYASVGIVATYWFQCTFFVAWMSIDQRRVESSRNGCICCYKHKNFSHNSVSRKSFMGSCFESYANLVTKTPSKVLVIAVAVVVTGFGVYGNVLLEQKFDLTWFLPPETYLAQWFVKNRQYFPFGGDRVIVYFHETDYVQDFSKIQDMVEKIKNQSDIVDDVNSWTYPFINYANNYLISDKSDKLPEVHVNETAFHDLLGQFMFSPRGGQYREKFKFDDDLYCGEASPYMILSQIEYQHKIFSGPKEHVPAMNRMKNLISNANLTGKVFALSMGYAFWETDEIIAEELYRNLALATVCVFITTLFLISNVVTSLMVLFCVILSLIDVGGFMHFWGLTIDTVSCNNLIIAIGLCVDYSAHIAHRFMVEQGDRNERIVKTLSHIGPAVLNGGFSTFLAFILLAGSRSHVFSTFFKIFFLVVVCGLFQGLVVLPVMLSIAGPKPNEVHEHFGEEREEVDDEEEESANMMCFKKSQSNAAEKKENESLA